jgi:NAD(P)-dependent dehydrogenase (short-subunit alcohol dehydrogenase family)
MFGRCVAINVRGPYVLIQALLCCRCLLIRRPSCSTPRSNAHVGAARSSVYAATRTAFLSLSKTLSSELLSRGIRVNPVSPGPVETPLYDKLGIPETYASRSTRTSPPPSHSAASANRKKSPKRRFIWLVTNPPEPLAPGSSSTVAARSTAEAKGVRSGSRTPASLRLAGGRQPSSH